jgi:hypothetical protein
LAWSFQITLLPMLSDSSLVGIERSATHALKIFESEAELVQNFFVRNALATVEGGAGSGDLTSFFLRDWLIVQGGHWRDCEPPDQSSLRADERRRKSGWGPDARSDRGPAVFRWRGPSGIVYQISAGQKDGCSARGEGWAPPSRACRRDPLLAEDSGFLFFRILEFSDICFGGQS